MIDRVATAEPLLVACDFDGTLAPIVDDPHDARALPGGVDALRRLAAAPATTVAIVSGRNRSELVERFGDDGPFLLIGEHGADAGDARPAETPALEEARRLVEEVARSTAGSRVEHKGRSVVFHYRSVSDPVPALERLREEASHIDEVEIMEGKAVLELTVSRLSKGDAIESLRRRIRPEAVMFIGDDVTDEAVFERLLPTDLGVKVGPGPTAARTRVDGPEEVGELLESLASAREAR